MRAPLGARGSYLPTAINVVQCLGWTVFELLVIATAAAALSDELFGFEARWAWTLVFGAAALALGLLGPIGVVRTVDPPRRRLGRPARRRVPRAGGRSPAAGSTRRGTDRARAASRPGRGSTSSSASRSRGSRSRPTTRASPEARGRRSGERASATSCPDALLLALGAVVLLTRDVADAAALPAAVAAGGLVALLALVALTVAETDEAFANAYSGAVSLQNLVPWAAAAAARRPDDDARDRRRARARADELPVVPLPARLVLRPALRRAPRRLARPRRALRADRRLRRAAAPASA